MNKDSNRCGNPLIDGLAHVGRLQSIWDRLAYYNPLVREHAERVWVARREGRIRRLVESDARFALLLAHEQEGPQSPEEWDLLALAALEAAGVERP